MSLYPSMFWKPPSPTAGTLLLDRNSNTYASDFLARVTRDQYQDWMRNFRDTEDDILTYATDNTQPLQAAQQAGTSIANSFGRVQGQIDRRNQRMGVSLSPDQQQAQQRGLNTAQGLSTVTAMNRAATQTRDRQNALLSGARSPSQNFAAGLQESMQ